MNADFWRGRSVFLTGHTGFKGAWLALLLRRLGARVCGYALAPSTNPNLYDELGGDDLVDHSTLADLDALDRLTDALRLSDATVVLHLAAQALVRPSYRDPVATFRTNVLGTVHVMEAVRRVGGVNATVIVTTDKCYENQERIWSYRENDPLGGRDPYSGSKGAAEIAASSYGRSFFGVQDGHDTGRGAAATARAGNVVGGGDWSEDRLTPDILRALISGGKVRIRRPDAIRPWQHVLEPLSGYLALAERLASDPAQVFNSWNFGPNPEAERSVIEVAVRICDLWGRPDALEVDSAGGPHEASLLTLDNTKARVMLGWTPRLSLDEALSWVVEWHKARVEGEDASRISLRQIERYLSR